jgi:hypothetical protein
VAYFEQDGRGRLWFCCLFLSKSLPVDRLTFLRLSFRHNLQDIRSLVKTLIIAVSLIYFFSVDPDDVSQQLEAMERAAAQAELDADAAAA